MKCFMKFVRAVCLIPRPKFAGVKNDTDTIYHTVSTCLELAGLGDFSTHNYSNRITDITYDC